MFYQGQHFGVSEYFCREQGENFSFPTHLHHSFELITALEGELTVKVAQATYELRPGEGVLIFPEQIHSLTSTKSRHLLFIFSSDLVSTYASRHAAEIPCSNRISVPPYALEQLLELNERSSVMRIKAMLYLVCAMLDEQTGYVRRRSEEQGLLRRIFDYVESNYRGACDLTSVSNAVGYHRAYLSRYFGEATSMTFVSYVNRYRVSKACHLLKNTDRSVLDCALECGYRSLRSFNRNFKTVIGLTPKEYRRSNATL